MRILVRTPDSYLPEREYIAGLVLSDFLGLDHRVETAQVTETQLSVEGSDEPRLTLADSFFRTPKEDWLTAQSLPPVPLARWDVGVEIPELAGRSPLPIVFGDTDPTAALLRESGSGLELGIDVLGSSFFLLTRYEEIAEPRRDPHERYLMEASLAHRENFLDRPIVNEYVDLLYALLKRLWPRLSRRSHESRLVVTHDVDVPLSVRRRRRAEYVRTVIGDAVKRRDPVLFLRRVNAYRHRTSPKIVDRDPAYTFDFILDQNERHGVSCWMNFMTETSGWRTVPYSLDEPWARTLLRQLHDRGHQIGFHPNYDSYKSREALTIQFDRLQAAARENGIQQERWMGRQHWLRWENPVTWQLWDDLGLAADGSLAYDLGQGFRCSVCYPYRVFNLHTRKALALKELPLTWMDAAQVGIDGRDPDEAVESAAALHAKCKRHGGTFTILWHNDSLVSKRQREAYVALLDLIA